MTALSRLAIPPVLTRRPAFVTTENHSLIFGQFRNCIVLLIPQRGGFVKTRPPANCRQNCPAFFCRLRRYSSRRSCKNRGGWCIINTAHPRRKSLRTDGITASPAGDQGGSHEKTACRASRAFRTDGRAVAAVLYQNSESGQRRYGTGTGRAGDGRVGDGGPRNRSAGHSRQLRL